MQIAKIFAPAYIKQITKDPADVSHADAVVRAERVYRAKPINASRVAGSGVGERIPRT